MQRKKHGNYYNRQNRTRIFIDERHDTYKQIEKHPEPTVCTQCGAHFKSGRWTWEPIPNNYYETVCPACQRSAENYPAGIINLSGPFFSDNSKEILRMAKNIEKAESSLHPLERIMSIKSAGNGETEICTTGIHIANRIANHLYDAYKGKMEATYDGESLVRIAWSR
jgi:NMD protein affecting ribosome stability and mRNA decay